MLNLKFEVTTDKGAYAVQADSPDEFNRGLRVFAALGLISIDQKGAPPVDPTPATPDEATPPETPAAPAAAPAKPRGRPAGAKAKADAKSEAAEPAANAQPDAVAATGSAAPKKTVDDCTKAITDLANGTSIDNALQALKRFGVKRASELQPEQFDEFVEFCEGKPDAAASQTNDVNDLV